MMIKAVIFDLDNTLYDYDYCNGIAEKILLQNISEDFDIEEDKAADLLYAAKKNVKERLGNEVAAAHNRLLYMQDVCEQKGQNPLRFAMKFYDIYWDAMLEHMEPFVYVRPLFQKLRDNKVGIGVLTDLTAHIQYRKLEKLGLIDYVDYMVTSEEAGEEKPSEKIFLLMLKKMKMSPEEVLMIGDSKDKDVDGAMHMGMNALLFDREKEFDKQVLRILGGNAI